MVQSKRSHDGYLLIDHRGSPGVDADFIRQSGKSVLAVPEGAVCETNTITCSHCQRVIIRNPNRPRPNLPWCPKCDHYVCASPGCDPRVGCASMDRILDTLANDAVHQRPPSILLTDRM